MPTTSRQNLRPPTVEAAGLASTSKNVAVLFTRREEKLSEEQRDYLERHCDYDEAHVADARRLTQECAKMARGLEGEKPDGWKKPRHALLPRWSASPSL